MDTSEVVRAGTVQRAQTVALLQGRPGPDFSRPCLPGWTVADVAAHLITVDRATVTGAILPALLRAGSLREFETWNDRAVAAWEQRSPDELLAALVRWGRRMDRLLRLGLPVLGRLRVGGPFGRRTLRFLAARRVLDEWVHGWDIRRVLEPAAASAPEVRSVHPQVVGVVADAVLGILPGLVLPRVTRATGVVRLEVLDPPAGLLRAWGIDFARRQYGPRVRGAPAATVRLTVAALALLASDRQAADDPTGVELEGDAQLGAELIVALGSRRWAAPAGG